MTSEEEKYAGDEYQLATNEEEVASKRTFKIVAAVAAAFLVAAVALTVHIQRGKNASSSPDTKYTVDYSKYGIPDDCDGVTTFCAENIESGSVQCTCGNYLFQYDEENGAWVLSNGNGGN